MSDDYDKSKNELLRKLKKMGEMAKEAKRMNKEFPASVVDELCHGAISAIKADKEMSRGRKEKAIENMGAASSHINRVFSEVSSIISPGQDLFGLGKDEENRKGSLIVTQNSISLGLFNITAQRGASPGAKEKGLLSKILEIASLVPILGKILEFLRGLF